MSSKQREQVSAVPAEASAPVKIGEVGPTPVEAAPVPFLLPIGMCLGKMVKCPECGQAMEVTHARGTRTPTQVVTSAWWVKGLCTGFCGAKLWRVGDVVELMPESIPKPVVKPLGAVVGRVVLCPAEIRLPDGSTRPCGREARAAWDMEQAHTVACLDCGIRAYPSELEVEVVG